MNKNTTFFSRARILTPPFSADPSAMRRWAVIACDQFTSEPDYWESCRREIGASPSTLGFIMPEAWLGTDEEGPHGETIRENMASFRSYDRWSDMRETDGFVYVERTLPDGSVRRGIVGAVDLEAYDYAEGSAPPVRAASTIFPPDSMTPRSPTKVSYPSGMAMISSWISARTAAWMISSSVASGRP